MCSTDTDGIDGTDCICVLQILHEGVDRTELSTDTDGIMYST